MINCMIDDRITQLWILLWPLWIASVLGATRSWRSSVPPDWCQWQQRSMVWKLPFHLAHGWNALKPEHKQIGRLLVNYVKPEFLMLSPPCTFFSPLMAMWNFKRMRKADKQRRKVAAHEMVNQSSDLCLEQHHQTLWWMICRILMNFENYTTFLQVGLTCVQVTKFLFKTWFWSVSCPPHKWRSWPFWGSMSWNSPWLVDICSIILGKLFHP